MTQPTKKRQRIGRLRTAQDVSKYIARSIKKAERTGGDGEVNIRYKLVMMASILLKSLEVSDLEKRITKLEELQNGA